MEFLVVLFVIFVGYMLYHKVHESKAAEEPIKFEQKTVTTFTEARNAAMAEKKASLTKVEKTSPPPKKAVAKAAPAQSSAKAESVALNVPEQVGLTAGVIWRYLDANEAVSVGTLVKALDADDKTIQRAIGWLAQEGKVELQTTDRSETIKLRR